MRIRGVQAEVAGLDARPPRTRAEPLVGSRGRWLFLVGVALAQGVLVLLNVAFPDWRSVDLDEEHNLPTYFQASLLAGASLLSVYALRVESRTLAAAGRRRFWATATWAGAALLFVSMALDEALVLHEEFNRDALRAWFRTTSPVQGTVVWLVILLPAIVAAMAGLLGWILARRTVSRAFCGLGVTAVGLWLAALVFEGTAKSVFIPLNLYRLEVLLEESCEALAPAVMCVAIVAYVGALRRRLPGSDAESRLRLDVPWRALAGTTLVALGIPGVIVAASIVLNPTIRLRPVADEHLRAGRFAEAAAAYRAIVERRPRWAGVWDRLGIAEYRLGNLAGAGQSFTNAARLSPRDARLVQHVGIVQYDQGRYPEAVETFRRAATLDPTDPDTLRNLAAALVRVGEEGEAAALRARASALAPEVARVVAMRVSYPADFALVYLDASGLEAALAHSRAGRVEDALAAYRARLDDARVGAAAHLGLANELLRWRAAVRLLASRAPIRVPDAEVAPVPPSALFADWVRHPDGHWEPIESVVTPPALGGDGPTLGLEAEQHYERALTLGAGAAARLGLAALAIDRGATDAATRHLDVARALDPGLPLVLTSALQQRIARP